MPPLLCLTVSVTTAVNVLFVQLTARCVMITVLALPVSTLSILLSVELARATVQFQTVLHVLLALAVLFVLPTFPMLTTSVSIAPSIIACNVAPIPPAPNVSQASPFLEPMLIIPAFPAATSTAVPVPRLTCALHAVRDSPS